MSRSIVDYTLKIKTANVFGSGTDNDVFITVYGLYENEEVNTGEINLSKRVNGNAFERNDEHDLHFQWEDIGRPTHIKLRLANQLLDDWHFAWCRIKRNGREDQSEKDMDINKEVFFDGNNDTKFKRKDSRIFYSDLEPLKEENIGNKIVPQYGGTEYFSLAPNGEMTITMNFSKEESNSVESSVIKEEATGHTINIGGEAGYSAGDAGGVEGKGSFSYGFSKSSLKKTSESSSSKLVELYAKETSIKIVNDGSNVIEYTPNSGQTSKNIQNGKTTLEYAIVYENSILELVRIRHGATVYSQRTDYINLGRRVRAILPVAIKDGKRIYIDSAGRECSEANKWMMY